MTKEQLAFEIFLRKYPTVNFTEQHRGYYIGAIEQAHEVAGLFLETIARLERPQVVLVETESNVDLPGSEL